MMRASHPHPHARVGCAPGRPARIPHPTAVAALLLLLCAAAPAARPRQDPGAVVPDPGASVPHPGAPVLDLAGARQPVLDAPSPAMPWQRNLADALALAARTGKPLLVCVNVAGEVASDSLAAGRYRDPRFAALAAGFLPVLASPDVHAGLEYDGRGRRVPCPAFGRMTCAEHAAVEPEAYARWFSGERVTPRHVGIAPDGKVLFDLFLLNDFGVLEQALREHGHPERALPDAALLDEQALLDDPDAAARELLEARFVAGDEATRLRLLAGALSGERATQHPALVAAGLRDASSAVRRAALDAATRHPSPLPLGLLRDAFRVATPDAGAHAALLQALGGSLRSDELRRLWTFESGGHGASPVLDLAAWTGALQREPAVPAEEPAPLDDATLSGRIDALDVQAANSHDPRVRAELARSFLDLAMLRRAAGEEDVGYLLEQAQVEARRAGAANALATPEATGDALALAFAVLARAAWDLGGSASDSAQSAALALPGLLASEPRGTLAADVLDVFAQARTELLSGAIGRDEEIDAQDVADLVVAARLLQLHPQSTLYQRVAALEALGALQLNGLHTELCWAALARDPEAPEVHEQLRWHLLRDGDALAIGATYEGLRRAAAADAQRVAHLTWFEAYAWLMGGDQLWRERRPEASGAAYQAALQGFASAHAAAPDWHVADWIGLAHAGRARLLMDAGDATAAAQALLDAAAASPAALELDDSLGQTAWVTGRRVEAALREAIAASAPGAAGATEALLQAMLQAFGLDS